MTGVSLMNLGLGLLGLSFFAVSLYKIKGIRLRGAYRYQVIIGSALFLFFLLQILLTRGQQMRLPQWALVTMLVGLSFGMAAGVLTVWGALRNDARGT